jgi:hypothetical protein
MPVLASAALVAASSAVVPAGCVIPLAPEFQDPPVAPNYPPYLVDTDPYRDTPVLGSNDPTLVPIDVTVADPNLDQNLYARWVADYPEYVAALTRQLGADLVLTPTKDGSPRIDRHFVDCRRFAQGMTSHRLAFIVSDRQFVNPEDAQNSELRYSEVMGPAPPYQVLMVTWPITCPP